MLGYIHHFLGSQLNFWGSDQAVEDQAFVALALVNVVWGSVWLEAWKRRSAGLTHRWGLPSESQELLQEPRPLYKVVLVFNNDNIVCILLACTFINYVLT